MREVVANASITRDGTSLAEEESRVKSSRLAPGVTEIEDRPGDGSTAGTAEGSVSASGHDVQTTNCSLPPSAAKDIDYEVDEQARRRSEVGDAWRESGPNSPTSVLAGTEGKGVADSPFKGGVSPHNCFLSQESSRPDGGDDGGVNGTECGVRSSSRCHGPDSTTNPSLTQKEGKENKPESSSKKLSSVSRMRSLEYLFFTGRTSGCSGEQTFYPSAACRDTWCGGVGDRPQPDLLKLAEDGFLVADSSETTEFRAGTGAARLGKPTSQPSCQPLVDLHDARSTANEQRQDRNVGQRWSSCGDTTFCSHLSEADVPGITGAKGGNMLTEGNKSCEMADHDVGAIDVCAEGRVDIHNSIVPPVCRVLVVKVYTGQSLRMGDSGGAKGIGGSGGGVLLGSDVLNDAWDKGFKSVCGSLLGDGGGLDGGVGVGGGERSSTSGTFRDQVRVRSLEHLVQYTL